MVYAPPRFHPAKWETQTSLGFLETNESPNLCQMTRISDSQQKKTNCWTMDFTNLADHRVKLRERKKRDKHQDLTRPCERTEKKTMEHESDCNTNCNWWAWYSHQRFSTGTLGLGNKRMSGDQPNYSIVEIG